MTQRKFRNANSVAKAAVERVKRRETIELAAMQAYEERLQKQQEETKKKSAGELQLAVALPTRARGGRVTVRRVCCGQRL